MVWGLNYVELLMTIAYQLTPETESHSERQSSDLAYSLIIYRTCYQSSTLTGETEIHSLEFADLLSNRGGSSKLLNR